MISLSRRSGRSRLVGYACSKPGCEAVTVGPSDDRTQGFTHTGDAAHITAASEDGPRWDADITSDERRSADNGIWLCTRHADLVDAKESVYPVDLLRRWKRRAEELADIRQEADRSPVKEMVPYLREIHWNSTHLGAGSGVKSDVRDFFEDVGAGTVMAPDDLQWAAATFIEVAANAIRDEAPAGLTLESRGNSIELRYPSKTAFGLADLVDHEHGRGGRDAVAQLESVTDGRMEINYAHRDGESVWILSLRRLGMADDPCSINLDTSDEDVRILFLSSCEDCERVNVYGSVHDSMSDNWVTARYVKELIDAGASVVVHAPPGGLAERLRRTIGQLLAESDKFELSIHL